MLDSRVEEGERDKILGGPTPRGRSKSATDVRLNTAIAEPRQEGQAPHWPGRRSRPGGLSGVEVTPETRTKTPMRLSMRTSFGEVTRTGQCAEGGGLR